MFANYFEHYYINNFHPTPSVLFIFIYIYNNTLESFGKC